MPQGNRSGLMNSVLRIEDHTVWAIAVVLIILWMLGLGTGFTMGLFIHILYVAAVTLLVIGLGHEVMTYQKLRHVSRRRGPQPAGKRRNERSTDQPIPSRIMP